jgi:hypothetical protein
MEFLGDHTMKTAELTGAALDWAVAKCENKNLSLTEFQNEWERYNFAASIDWAQGGAIIQRQRISLLDQGGDCWLATCGWKEFFGDTQLEAAMRAYVAFTLGEEVEVPEELQEITQ